jgi:hypothetical protein
MDVVPAGSRGEGIGRQGKKRGREHDAGAQRAVGREQGVVDRGTIFLVWGRTEGANFSLVEQLLKARQTTWVKVRYKTVFFQDRPRKNSERRR